MLLGGLLLATGRHDEAGQEFREALRLCERLVEEVPGRHVYLHRLASAHEHLGRLHLARGQRGEALQHWRQAVTLCEKLSIDFPGVARYGKDLEETRRKLEKLAQEQAP
jgi:tetratricopeptide (TPR) repeat protein